MGFCNMCVKAFARYPSPPAAISMGSVDDICRLCVSRQNRQIRRGGQRCRPRFRFVVGGLPLARSARASLPVGFQRDGGRAMFPGFRASVTNPAMCRASSSPRRVPRWMPLLIPVGPRRIVRMGRPSPCSRTSQSGNAVEAEGGADIELHIGPSRQIGGAHPHQPFLAWVTLHAHPRGAPAPRGEVVERPFGMLDLRQDTLGGRQQMLSGLGEAEAAPLLRPDLDAVAFHEFADGVAQGRLAGILLCGGGDAAQPIDLAQDRKQLAINHP